MISVYPGDYIKFETSGGVMCYGDVSTVFGDGTVSVIPDGGKNPIPILPEQVTGIEKGGHKRQRAEWVKERTGEVSCE